RDERSGGERVDRNHENPGRLSQIDSRAACVVKLNSGVDYRGHMMLFLEYFLSLVLGILACLDGYMNIAMEQTEEYVNGQLKNKYAAAVTSVSLDSLDSVLYISTAKRTLGDGA
ncbi:hypothetical protein C3L33_15297, partial [Rhododendron williamsianum]